jgi:hypothetical protein
MERPMDYSQANAITRWVIILLLCAALAGVVFFAIGLGEDLLH